MRNLWVASRRRFYRLVLLAALLWAGYDVVFSNHGWIHLRALGIEEKDLQRQTALVSADLDEVRHQIQEDPAVAAERAIREKYLRSRKNEIVYRIETVEARADSSLGARPAGAPAPSEDAMAQDPEEAGGVSGAGTSRGRNH